MSVYDIDGNELTNVYDLDGTLLSRAYDVDGNQLIDDGEEFIKTILPYDFNYIIKSDWLNNATTQRDRMILAYKASNDAIPFFIQTDGHGKKNEGNKGCHNLAEEQLGYIRNIQLGDYDSYYYDGNNPRDHKASSVGIAKYIPVMGNHEFMNNNAQGAELADLPTLVDSYVASDGILGSQTYGYYKVLDDRYSVKYLVTQPHIPDASKSSGLVTTMTSDQYAWLIDELGANDGYDVVLIQHEPVNGTYIRTDTEASYTCNIPAVNIAGILSARKAKSAGTFTDPNGTVHTYDFTNCTSDLLCSLHGHIHIELYMTKETLGFPSYVADWFSTKYIGTYGLIDRANGKLKIWKFNSTLASDVLELDL